MLKQIKIKAKQLGDVIQIENSHYNIEGDGDEYFVDRKTLKYNDLEWKDIEKTKAAK